MTDNLRTIIVDDEELPVPPECKRLQAAEEGI